MDRRDEAKEEIKSRLAIEDVVGQYVDLKRSGASYKGLCPFHQEKTPSFYVSPQRGTYHCFGCSRGGDSFSFIMEMEHLSFPDAMKRLAEQAGVSLPEREQQKPSLKGRLYEANEAALRFFRHALEGAEGKRAVEYLFERGFGQEAIDLFDLGYAPQGREGLVRSLHEGGLDDRVLLAAGLVLQDDVGGRVRDRFRGRLMFPIRDASGKISGFGGRILGEGQPKYLNSPQTEVFDKSSVLFGIQLAQDTIRQSGRAVLVEGYLDAVRAHLGGYRDTVASLGTAVTVQQLTALSRLTERVILALDPDAAGQSAAARTSLTALAELTRSRGRSAGQAAAVDLRIAQLPPGQGDPDDLIRDQPTLWEQALDESVPAFEFCFNQVLDSLDRSSDAWRPEAIDRLLPLIQQFSSSAGWQAIWVERLARETGTDARAIQGNMPASQPRRKPQKPGGSDVVSRTTARALTSDPVLQSEQSLLALLLQILVVPREASEALDGAQLQGPEHQTILDHLLSWQNYDYETFRESLPEDAQTVADALRGKRVAPAPDGKLSITVKVHLARLRHARLHTQLMRAQQLMQSMTPEDQAAGAANIAALSEEKRRVDQELRELQQLVVQAGARHGTMDHDSGSL